GEIGRVGAAAEIVDHRATGFGILLQVAAVEQGSFRTELAGDNDAISLDHLHARGTVDDDAFDAFSALDGTDRRRQMQRNALEPRVTRGRPARGYFRIRLDHRHRADARVQARHDRRERHELGTENDWPTERTPSFEIDQALQCARRDDATGLFAADQSLGA